MVATNPPVTKAPTNGATMEPPNEFASLVPLYKQLRGELKLDPASFQVPPPPAPRPRPTVRLLDGRRFRGVYFNGAMDGETPYFYFTINPRLARLSLPLTIWRELPADRVPTQDQDKRNLYPCPGCEGECWRVSFTRSWLSEDHRGPNLPED